MLRFIHAPSFLLLLLVPTITKALRYDPSHVGYNLNENAAAATPLDYWGQWDDHQYHPSPDNWRMPFYTIFLDRFANGDPMNDDANGTAWEHDVMSNQFRNGGDVRGLMGSLDYLQGMGIKGLYLAGSPHINLPWGSDGYSPLDLTLLDRHFGNIDDWRAFITEAHRRGMYVVLENTMATMGDLIGFENYLNTSTPFRFDEHNAVWKSGRRYHDFHPGNGFNDDCKYPTFWRDNGSTYDDVLDRFQGRCRDSEFDQYGDIAAFGNYTEWQRQLSKFAFVQDRLREWNPDVLAKIKHFSCITISMLDIDGFRIDKALQVTVDAQGDWSDYIRGCARSVGKNNFFIPGEVVSGNAFGAVYYGRGKQPSQAVNSTESAVLSTNESDPSLFIRSYEKGALDGAAFHYSVYRALTRFLGLDGVFEAEMDTPVNWVDGWNAILQTNDLVNANTGIFDPRHMYGVTNQDVFRWPGIRNGTEKQLLGLFITTLHLPGIPMLVWGEEQAFYVLDSTADNYLYGRSPMTSALAWQIHGCYRIGSQKYFNFPLDKALYGCLDDRVSLDQRDPSHPIRNVIKQMNELRQLYPVLNDGYYLQQLSNQTRDIFLPGSKGIRTETGMWSTVRARFETQDFGQGNQSVWFVYSNEDQAVTFQFDCADKKKALIAPFDQGMTVKNLFYPYDEYHLEGSSTKLGLEGSSEFNGCLAQLALPAWGFKAFVPKQKFMQTSPVIIKFLPYHDQRIQSTVPLGSSETLQIQIHFSDEMNCEQLTKSLEINSTTDGNKNARLDEKSVSCRSASNTDNPLIYSGQAATTWVFMANLVGVANGIHTVTVRNVSTTDGSRSTNSVDRFMFRIGQSDNPMVFTKQSNYTMGLFFKDPQHGLWVSHKAAGADKWRYSLNWGSTYSDWQDYQGGHSALPPQKWSGTKLQRWNGEHVIVQYWSNAAGSSDHIQHADLDGPPRRFPHVFVQGPFNQYGFDAGIPNRMKLSKDSNWQFNFMTEWPDKFQLSVWGMNPDGNADQTAVFGDVDNDTVIDRIPPISLIDNVINVSTSPPSPYLSYRIILSDAEYTYKLVPTGSRWQQLALYLLLGLIPIITGAVGIRAFMASFYQVKFNDKGNTTEGGGFLGGLVAFWQKAKVQWGSRIRNDPATLDLLPALRSANPSNNALAMEAGHPTRKTVLIATMEYDIEDWGIKIKIGGLGVMAQLMGKALGHQDVIWVIPCVGGIDYPQDQPADDMIITILGAQYVVQVQYHTLRNITYVLLDAPVFRQQTKTEPYPPRMDDLDSAIYYSAWNSCIAEAIRRFPVDLYHINDYHGALAPLHLLPNTIPCCLSLHNAEFQGLWPMRKDKEREEVNHVFNLDPAISEKYVQFGEAFNLLHAGASYLRIHQKGFGAVGVSKKYGKRSYARYPIFWGLKGVGSLPNPDPDDVGEWNGEIPVKDEVMADPEFEARRGALRVQAQEWAGLEQDASAELFVFVGRWSLQKGVDLIADVFPAILDKHPKTQLICIGPVIDLYGKFAALKLDKMMQLYPNRVFSKPEFTALPPYIFSGAEFALIPSRDEPFGLVAVEFGRKGALGVGARVGGLGQMPGWWYTVESTTTKHLLQQFKGAIQEALSSKSEVRAKMRARSSLQRFPVARWVEDLDVLQSTAIKIHQKEVGRRTESKSPNRQPGNRLLRPPPITFNVPNTLTAPHEHFSSGSPSPSIPGTPVPFLSDDPCLTPATRPSTPTNAGTPLAWRLSVSTIVGERKDFFLQQTSPFFTDGNGEHSKAFSRKLDELDSRNSETVLCIEEYLIKGEKEWFRTYNDAKLGRQTASPASSIFRGRQGNSGLSTPVAGGRGLSPARSSVGDAVGYGEETPSIIDNEFLLGEEYVPPKGLKKFLQLKFRDWPIYTFLIAFGQIIAANSYQITLLTGEIGQTALKLYAIAAIYLAASLVWWLVYRTRKAVYVLSLPFLFYGLAFLLVGLAYFVGGVRGKAWMHNVASGLYAVASASGSIFFALNFGDEGGAPVETWVYRACWIQGSQQIYVVVLWFWGSALTRLTAAGTTQQAMLTSSRAIVMITAPIAVLMFCVGVVLFVGLPDYYHRQPGKVPSFYASLLRRKTILWFFVMVVVQNYFLSAPYGRNWRYLFSSRHVPAWQIGLLVVGFFIGVWALFLWYFAVLSKRHSWILPVFAIGLGCPRWCQMLWATSNIGLYVPWAGGPAASAFAGRALWLWLGVLDALQGVGIGMILLQTLTRFHIAFTLVAGQVLGSIATVLARATAPNNVGPGDVFPDFSAGPGEGLSRPWFWIALLFQILLCGGFFLFFRKEQLSKP